MTLCEMADRGVLPERGGWLDQTAWFADVYKFWRREQAKADRRELEQMNRAAKRR